jgi:hypothetical protein
MATKPITRLNTTIMDVEIFQWDNLALNDDGDVLESPKLADKTVQVYGTFGAGGKVILEGTCNLTSPVWAQMHDPQGNLLDFTSSTIRQVLENPLKIRPRVTTGDGTTNLTMVIICRR